MYVFPEKGTKISGALIALILICFESRYNTVNFLQILTKDTP